MLHTNDHIPARKVRQVLFLAIIGLLGWFIYREMQFMLGAFLGAVALYTLLRRPMFRMVYQWKWPKALSALLLILLTFIIIIMPLSWVVNFLIDEISSHLKDTSKIQENVLKIEAYLQKRYNIDLLSEGNVAKVPGFLATLGGKLVNTTLNTLANLFIMYFILWFMLVKVGGIEKWVQKHLPLKSANRMRLMRESNQVVVSNAVGIPVLGAVQGIVAMIGYLIFGVENAVLWGVITGISSVIPFVGTMAAWVPLVILRFAAGDTDNGIWLGLWGLIVIGGSDNIFRFILQKYMADIHPLITVFGVIVGLGLFGFLGLIFGPLLISLFILLIKIYYDEYVAEDIADEAAGLPDPTGTTAENNANA